MNLQGLRVDVFPYCLCTSVTPKALAALLESGVPGADGRGSYRDEHPWFAARELLGSAEGAGQALPLVIATGDPLELSHWALVTRIDVVELHRGQWETACDFGRLRAVNPIWTALDSLFLKPGDDQLRRERLEPIRKHRQVLDAQHVFPYAICETPAFVARELGNGETSEGGEEPRG